MNEVVNNVIVLVMLYYAQWHMKTNEEGGFRQKRRHAQHVFINFPILQRHACLGCLPLPSSSYILALRNQNHRYDLFSLVRSYLYSSAITKRNNHQYTP